MGVDRYRRLADGRVQYLIGGLAADARLGLQRLAIVRHLAAMPFVEDATGGDEVLRLVLVEIDGLDVILEPLFAELQHRSRGVRDLEQFFSGLVDPFVGGLRRKNHRNEQFERARVIELRRGMGIRRLEAFEHALAFFRRHSRCAPCRADVTEDTAGRVARLARARSTAARIASDVGATSAASSCGDEAPRCFAASRALRSVSSRARRCKRKWRRRRAWSAFSFAGVRRADMDKFRYRTGDAEAGAWPCLTGTMRMQSTGQGAMQSSQPVHSSATTVCMSLLAPRIASTGQACMQSVQPMQSDSSMTATVCPCFAVPFAELMGCGATPSNFASARTPTSPPGGHWLMSAAPCAIASAYGRQAA